MATRTVSQIPARDKLALALKAHPLCHVFVRITDWRKRQGKVYQLAALFMLLLFGLMCGKRGPTSIVRWFRKLPFEVRMRLRFPLGRCPAPVTLCRLLQDVDVVELERQLRQWLRTINPQLAAAGVKQRLALDGKTLRGAAKRGAPAAHLLAAFSQQLQTVVGQVAVDCKTNEITLVVELLDLLMIEGRLLTMDALLTQRAIAQEIINRQGDYLMVVKENQPQLLEDLRICFQEEPLPGEVRGVARATNKSHGREEVREIVTSAALQDYLDWPGAAQVMRIRRTITTSKTGATRSEEVYAITSLSPERGRPADLLAANRGHWGIENRLHWVRDVTFGEDHCPVCKKNAPQAFAALRNVLLALLRFLGHTNIAEAIDIYSADPALALVTLGATEGK